METVKALNDANLLSLSGVRQLVGLLMFVEGAAACQGDGPLRNRYNENRLARKDIINGIESRGELRKRLYFCPC
jgi:hypothetical protein